MLILHFSTLILNVFFTLEALKQLATSTGAASSLQRLALMYKGQCKMNFPIINLQTKAEIGWQTDFPIPEIDYI